MFNKDFFPTPDHVATEMLMHIDVAGKVVLEPSAGKGDLANEILKAGAKQVITAEIEPQLRKILERYFRIVGNDFLEMQSHNVSHVDCIIGNPPFSADEKHILHAWEIAPEGCEILMLCNWNTLANRYSKERQEIANLAAMYGKMVNMGKCFENAERSTDVTVGMIYLRKPGNNTSEFDGFFMEPDEEEQQSNGIMQYNVVRDVVNRYVEACRIFEQQIQMGVQMSAVLGSFFNSKIAFKATKDNHHVVYSDFKKDLQKSAWNYVIGQMNLNKYSTAGLKEDINKFVERQTEVPFTMRNIYRMIEMVIGTASARMDKAIIEVFDKLTMHYDENRWNVEGWKTNSHYLVNEKFIMPGACNVSWAGNGITFEYGNHGAELMNDFQKALCYICGVNYDDMVDLGAINGYTYMFKSNGKIIKETAHSVPLKCRENELVQFLHKLEQMHANIEVVQPIKYGEWYRWGFFDIKCFKKKTVHCKFVDTDVWAIFNREVARIKGYPLPEAIKRNK